MSYYRIGPKVVYLSAEIARTKVTPQIIVIVLHGVLNVGVTTSQEFAPKTKPVQTSKKGCPIFKALLKRCKTRYSFKITKSESSTDFASFPNSLFPSESFLRLRYRFQ